MLIVRQRDLPVHSTDQELMFDSPVPTTAVKRALDK
jgi:hypothetical protein